MRGYSTYEKPKIIEMNESPQVGSVFLIIALWVHGFVAVSVWLLILGMVVLNLAVSVNAIAGAGGGGKRSFSRKMGDIISGRDRDRRMRRMGITF